MAHNNNELFSLHIVSEEAHLSRPKPNQDMEASFFRFAAHNNNLRLRFPAHNNNLRFTDILVILQ